MSEKMEALENNKTWKIERQKGKKSVDCKWIYTMKYKAYGSLDHNKAKLVAKGYTHPYEINY